VVTYFWISVATSTPIDLWVAALFTVPAAWIMVREAVLAVRAVQIAKAERSLCEEVNRAFSRREITLNNEKALALGVDFAFERQAKLQLVICAPREGDGLRYARQLKTAVKTARKTTPCLGWLVIEPGLLVTSGRSLTAVELGEILDSAEFTK
jgi:hypothetical protein